MAKYFFDLYEEFKDALEGKKLGFRGVIETPYFNLSHTDSETRTAGDIALTGEGISVFRGADDTDKGLANGSVYAPEITFKNENFINGEIFVRLRVLGSYQTSPENFSNNGPSFSFRKKELDITSAVDCVVLQTAGSQSGGSTFEWINGVREGRLPFTTGWTSTQPFRNPFKYINYRVKLDGRTWSYKDWIGDKDSEPDAWNKTALDSGIINMEEGFLSFFIYSNNLSLSIVEIGIGTDQDSAPIYKVANPPASNTRFISGNVTLDGQPYSSRLVVTSVGDNPRVLAKGSSDVDGNYNIPVGLYDGTVLVHSVQDYGDNWQPSTALEFDQVIHPTVPNGYVFRVTSAGTTGTQEPTWPALPATQVTDGGVTYTSEILLEPVIQGYVNTTLV